MEGAAAERISCLTTQSRRAIILSVFMIVNEENTKITRLVYNRAPYNDAFDSLCFSVRGR